MTRPVSHLASLDLNLLVALRELLRERNVTRAAERLGVTQPAASAALARLRRHFGDDLLVRAGGRYVPTPLASSLVDQVEAVCAAAERLLATDKGFDPASSGREFTLLMADYTVAIIGERLSRLVHLQGPGVALHVRLVRESLATEYGEMVRLIDGMVAPPASPFRLPAIRSTELFSDRWVLVVAADNPAGDRLDLDDLARLPWVVPYHQGSAYSRAPIARQLRLLGMQPRIAVRVESYLAVPYFIVGTDRIALMQERLASKFVDTLGLAVRECPAELEPLRETLWWHECYDDDPGHAWLRQLLAEAAHGLDEADGLPGGS